MVTLPCVKPLPNRDSSTNDWPSRPKRLSRSGFNEFGWSRPLAQGSCTVKNSRQLIRVFAFAVERSTDGSEGLGEGKNIVRYKQIGIFRPHRMPVHTFSGNRNFRH